MGALVGQYEFVVSFEWLSVRDEVFQGGVEVSPWLVLDIFFFNLVLSGFVLVTLSGLAFFVLPLVFLFVRAFLWGVLLNGLSTSMFLAAFPTLILEGEGYVLAALAGINLGMSWFKPKRVYGEEELSRIESVKMALKDCLRIYA
ncbi:MAG: stage II sporulation protein M [Candidatus Bathyarchaeaceae archaeon]